MEQGEVNRWARAAELLDQVLDYPADDQQAQAIRLGASHGCSNELTQMLEAARETSLLDGTLEGLMQAMPEPAPTVNEYRGKKIGNWRLGDEIGRGGMSVVYHAERAGQDFDQRAALKILSVGYLGDSFVDSFLRERQILSDLHHPGIARLIDGGITPDGAPFLVMQFVEGQPVNQWCEAHQADLKTITRLMIQLCDAVAYQQKHLVVHQDINPANVLVDEHGRPIVIDFGIASLLGPASEDDSLRAFTPRYAAPEQRAGGLITTATDVYALGKLFQTLTDGLVLDGELQKVLDVATQEDPEQRYVNARQLANDLVAWRDKRPLAVKAHSRAYRLQRFIGRNRWGVAAASLIIISLLGGLGLSIWQARVAAAERDVAQIESQRANQVTVFLKNLFLASDPDRSMGEPVSARQLLDQGAHQARTAFIDVPELKAEMLVLVGSLYRELGEMESADSVLTEALSLAESVDNSGLYVDALAALAKARMDIGEHEEALELAERAEHQLHVRQQVPGRQHAGLMEPLLFSLTELGRVNESIARGELALADARLASAVSPDAMYDYLYNLANALLVAERFGEAENLLLEAVELEFESLNDPSVQIGLHSTLASVYTRRGAMLEALRHDQAAVELARTIYSPIHSQRARKLSNLGSTLSSLGRVEDAEKALLEAVAIYEELYPGRSHPRVASATNNLAIMLKRSGEYEAALPYMQQVRQMAEELFGREDPRYSISTANLGDLRRLMGNFEEAETLLLENLATRKSVHGPDHPRVGGALSLLAQLRLDQQKYQQALERAMEALALYERANYDHLGYILVATSRKAQALAGLGLDEEARETFKTAFEIADEAGENVDSLLAELQVTFDAFEARYGMTP